MAIVTSGPFLGFTGSVGGITYYQLPDGRTVAKGKNSRSTKGRTEGQKTTQNTMAMISQFVKPFEEFTKVTYKHLAKSQQLNTHNSFVKHIWAKALAGPLGEQKIAPEKLLVSQGTLSTAQESTIRLTTEGIAFSWNAKSSPEIGYHTDQVIMLAFFPELEEIVYKIGGNERRDGESKLSLRGVEKGYLAEVYIAFITNDHSILSNSIHLGQINW